MTHIEKANELIKFYSGVLKSPFPIGCSIKCVDEILLLMETDDKRTETCYWINSPTYKYWEQVEKDLHDMLLKPTKI